MKSDQFKSFPTVAKGAYQVYNAEKMHGLPLGVQVVGGRLEEEKVLEGMQIIEAALHEQGSAFVNKVNFWISWRHRLDNIRSLSLIVLLLICFLLCVLSLIHSATINLPLPAARPITSRGCASLSNYSILFHNLYSYLFFVLWLVWTRVYLRGDGILLLLPLGYLGAANATSIGWRVTCVQKSKRITWKVSPKRKENPCQGHRNRFFFLIFVRLFFYFCKTQFKHFAWKFVELSSKVKI